MKKGRFLMNIWHDINPERIKANDFVIRLIIKQRQVFQSDKSFHLEG